MENSFSCSEENYFPWFHSSCESSSAAAAAAAFVSWPIEERGVMSASKSHSEAEKRRRDRINAQLATLRKLIPKSEKMDKAALLSSVVEHMKDLKRKATEISKTLLDVPTDTDEVSIVDQHSSNNIVAHEQTSLISPNLFLKASVCCDDRPELFAEINRALKDLRLTTVHADVTSLGGRVKSVFVLLCPASHEGICINSLKHSLKVALCKIAIPSSTTSYRIKSKRQRFFLPSHYH